MDTQINQTTKSADRKYQFHIVLLAFAPALLLFFVGFPGSGSSVQIGSELGKMFGQVFIPMLIGLITYSSAKKKLVDPNDAQGLIKARNKALIAVVITYAVLLAVFLGKIGKQMT